MTCSIKFSFRHLVWLLFFVFATGSIAHPQTPDSTRQLRLEKIEIVGNTKTNANVILRQLTLRPGDPLDPAILAINDQRLSHTNFFKEVEFYTRPGSEKGQVVVVIEVKERKWPYFQFEGGHSDLDGWYLVPASLRFDNFFGDGNLIGLSWRLGDRVSKVGLNFRTVNLFDGNAFLALELFGGNQQFIHYFGPNQVEQRVPFGGLNAVMGGTKGFFKYVYFGYRSENYNPDAFVTFTDNDSNTTNLPPEVADDIGKTHIGAFSVGLYADLRDNPAYPLNGFWGALSAELAHDEVGSDVNFSKFTLDTRFFKRVFGRQVLAFHFKGGYASGMSPFYERFYLGGANSLRGYPDRRLTPEGWGTRLMLTNTEFRFPLSSKNFPYHTASAVLFFDAGGIWLPGESIHIDDFFTAAGFGFRVKLPVVGVTRFDFSFPLHRLDNNDFQFHISLGHTF